MNLSRVHRLLKLIGLLQAGRRLNVESLAQACDVSRRTIFRDLETLREANLPLVYDEQRQGYHIPSTYFLPPTNFTPEEALALIVLCHEMGDKGRLPFFGPARTAALKLASSLPGRLRDRLREVADLIQIKPAPLNPLPEHQTTFEQVLGALSQQLAIRVRYESFSENETILTRISPYRLLFSRRSWYVIGRSSLHRATRTFNVGRIQEVTLLEDGYQIPRGFSVDRYLRNAWHLIPERGADRKVVIRFSPMVARNVAEVNWHKTQQLKFNDDGTLDYQVTVSGLKEMSWWVLGYGDQADVLSPPEMRRIIAERASNMLRKYE